MRQVEIEAGIGRDEAYVGAPARRHPRLREAADTGAGVRRPQPRKTQRGRLGELVDELEFQLLAFLETQKRAGRRAGVSVSRGRFRRGWGQGEPRGRDLEGDDAVGRSGKGFGAGRTDRPRRRRQSSANRSAPGEAHDRRLAAANPSGEGEARSSRDSERPSPLKGEGRGGGVDRTPHECRP